MMMMMMMMIVSRCCSYSSLVLVLLLSILPWRSRAWVSPPSVVAGTGSSTGTGRLASPPSFTTMNTGTTRLAMFDWLNPNKATQAARQKKQQQEAPADEKNAAETSEKHHQPGGDCLTNMFESMAPPSKEEETTLPTTTATAAAENMSDFKPEKSLDGAVEKQEVVLESPPTDDAATTDSSIAVHKGKVQWFSSKKGYGFLLEDGHSDDGIFVHHSAILVDNDNDNDKVFRTLRPDEPIEFQLETDHQGRHRATRVTGPDGTPVQEVLRQQHKWHQNKQNQD